MGRVTRTPVRGHVGPGGRMAHLALMTIGLLHGPEGDPRVQGFFDRVDATFAAADASAGLVLRIDAPGAPEAGPPALPAAFRDPAYAGRLPQALSVWRGLEAAFAYAYRNVHGEALRDRHAWFVKLDLPSHVAWWIPAGAVPTWEASAERFDRLAALGPTPAAFTLHAPFDAEGRACQVDREAVRRLAASTAG